MLGSLRLHQDDPQQSNMCRRQLSICRTLGTSEAPSSIPVKCVGGDVKLHGVTVSMYALQGSVTGAPFWAHGICTSVALREAAGAGSGTGAGGSYPSVAPQSSDDQTNPTSSKAPSSNPTSQNSANQGASAAKIPSTSNIPPRLEVSGISSPSEADAGSSQQQQQPSVRPVGAASDGVGQGPSPPGSRGRVTPTPAAAAAAASESVPAPRVAQVLGYAGGSMPLPALNPHACAGV